MEQDDPPLMTLAQMQAELAEGMADVGAGHTVPLAVILAELDAGIIEAERNQHKITAIQATQ